MTRVVDLAEVVRVLEEMRSGDWLYCSTLDEAIRRVRALPTVDVAERIASWLECTAADHVIRDATAKRIGKIIRSGAWKHPATLWTSPNDPEPPTPAACCERERTIDKIISACRKAVEHQTEGGRYESLRAAACEMEFSLAEYDKQSEKSKTERHERIEKAARDLVKHLDEVYPGTPMSATFVLARRLAAALDGEG